MTAQTGSWVAENTSTAGTGAIALAGAISEHTTFATVMTVGEVWYSIKDSVGNRECGIGDFNGSGSIARTDVHATLTAGVYSNSVTPLSLVPPSVISCTFNAMAYRDINTNISSVAASVATKMNWMSDWVAGVYIANDVVRAEAKSYVANKTTEDYPVPEPQGDEYPIFEGIWSSLQVTAKQVLFGQRHTLLTDHFLNAYSLQTVVGNHYELFSIKDPLGAREIESIISFVADIEGEVKATLVPRLLPIGTVFDFMVRVNEPDPAPVTIVANYNYITPKDPSIPASGGIVHADDINKRHMNISHTGSSGEDMTGTILGLSIGDIIRVGGLEWAVQSNQAFTGYNTIGVAPEDQYGLEGVASFTFETIEPTPITTAFKVDHWINNPNIQGLYGVDTDYTDITPSDDAHGINMYVQAVSVSEDWEEV
jgi:hypothetical protein